MSALAQDVFEVAAYVGMYEPRDPEPGDQVRFYEAQGGWTYGILTDEKRRGGKAVVLTLDGRTIGVEPERLRMRRYYVKEQDT